MQAFWQAFLWYCKSVAKALPLDVVSVFQSQLSKAREIIFYLKSKNCGWLAFCRPVTRFIMLLRSVQPGLMAAADSWRCR
ncbi:MAG: hypothetical protein KDK05_24120, partial [Candidatus Competibacteraceae bacterium]|nr:hypothetical protein [Candidatus Competibacteraceae bacterium]